MNIDEFANHVWMHALQSQRDEKYIVYAKGWVDGNSVLIAQAAARGRLFRKLWCQKLDLIDFRNEYRCVIALFDLFVLCLIFSFDDDDADDRFYVASFSALE